MWVSTDAWPFFLVVVCLLFPLSPGLLDDGEILLFLLSIWTCFRLILVLIIHVLELFLLSMWSCFRLILVLIIHVLELFLLSIWSRYRLILVLIINVSELFLLSIWSRYRLILVLHVNVSGFLLVCYMPIIELLVFCTLDSVCSMRIYV